MKAKLLSIILIAATAVLIVAGVFAHHNAKAAVPEQSDEISGYTKIICVPGISFYINTPFVDKATAITQITEDISFQNSQYYSYKNGVDKYLLFNMDGIIVAAEKGTDFWLDEASDPEYALSNTSLSNIWFTKGTKKLNTSTRDDRTTTLVKAGVTINSTTYGDFCGKLININKDGEEWSLFVGVPGERYDKLPEKSKDGIDGITDTLKFAESSDLLSRDTYAVSLNGNGAKEIVDMQAESFDYEDSLNLSNQSKVTDKDSKKAYTSTPYSMLTVSDNGILSAFNDYESVYEEPVICIKHIYSGEETDDIIKDHIHGRYDFVPAPDGCHWEAAEYDLNYRNCKNDDYVNIKLKGLDAEPLKFRGIKHSARTYDCFDDIKEDGDWITGYLSYYAVPNGCEEYCLEAGERRSVNGEETNAAYYYVNTKNVHGEQNLEHITVVDTKAEQETNSDTASVSENLVVIDHAKETL